MGDIYHAGEVYAGSVPIDDTQASEDKVYSSVKTEELIKGGRYVTLVTNKAAGVNQWVDIPSGCDELIVVANYLAVSLGFTYTPQIGNVNLYSGCFETTGKGGRARLNVSDGKFTVDIFQWDGTIVTSNATFSAYYKKII